MAGPRPPEEQAQVAPTEVPNLSSLLSLAVAVVVVVALYLARDVFVPIMLAVLLAFVLAPLVGLLRRLRLGRTPSVVLAVLVALGIIGTLAAVIGGQIANLAGNVPAYSKIIQGKLENTRDSTLGRMSQRFGNISRQIERAGESDKQTSPSAGTTDAGPAPLRVEVHEPPASSLETAVTVLSPILGPLETTIIVLIVAIFVLLQREDLRDRIIRLFGSKDLHRTTTAMDDAAARLSRYFLTQLALNAAFGTVIGTGLYFIGIPSPVLWGILAALLRFVPYIGAFLAALPPLLLGAAVDPGWTMVIGTAALFLVAEPVMGYVVEPMVYGHSTGLSPTAIIVAAIFWTWLWGPIGLILSTPLTLCLVVLGRHVERLEFLDVLFGDRPALTPVESFYQRMLAGDADEVLEQAELLLKERSLSSYYDEVIAGGLCLALADRRRGVLSRERLEEVARATEDLIDNLSDYEDRDPTPEEGEAPAEPATASIAEKILHKDPAPAEQNLPHPWGAPGAIACVGGEGPVNAVLAAMLAQLLGKHGFGTATFSIGGFGSARCEALAVCLVYANITRTRGHLKSRVRELRERFAGASMIVGLWNSSSAAGAARESGSDHCASSLSDFISSCNAAAANLRRSDSEGGRVEGPGGAGITAPVG